MSSFIGIKRRDPHEPVYPYLRLQITIGIWALDLHNSALYPCSLARQHINDLSRYGGKERKEEKDGP